MFNKYIYISTTAKIIIFHLMVFSIAIFIAIFSVAYRPGRPIYTQEYDPVPGPGDIPS